MKTDCTMLPKGFSPKGKQENETGGMVNLLCCRIPSWGCVDRLLAFSLIFAVLTIGGCAAPSSPIVQPPPAVIKPIFPPQEVMVDGNYSQFLTKNQTALIDCTEESQCAVALFNLGFLRAYPQSPYYNPSKGLVFFESLISRYPQHPLAYQAKVWADLLKRSIASETTKHRLKGQLKSRETTIRELQRRVEQSKQVDAEMDRIEEDLQKQMDKSRQAEERQRQGEKSRQIEHLQRQIDKSRQIDVEMERKERELLQ